MIRQILLTASLLMLGSLSALAQEPATDAQTQAAVGFFGMMIIGILAGWIAEKITASDHGLLTNLLVGIAGSFLGGWLAQLMNIQFNGWLGNLLVAAVGAVYCGFGGSRRATVPPSKREQLDIPQNWAAAMPPPPTNTFVAKRTVNAETR